MSFNSYSDNYIYSGIQFQAFATIVGGAVTIVGSLHTATKLKKGKPIQDHHAPHDETGEHARDPEDPPHDPAIENNCTKSAA
jgi:hypothetical protein